MDKTQEAEFVKRRDEFLQRYKALIDELEVDFISIPQYVPNDKGTWETLITSQVMDKKNQLTPSPITI